MNRRNFLYTGSSALAAFAFNTVLRASGSQDKLLAMPEKVLMQTGDKIVELRGGTGKWTYGDVWLQLTTDAGGMHVTAGAPGIELQQVQLVWKDPSVLGAGILGDHWERTYGDVSFQSADASRKMPWYYVQHNGEQALCYGVKTGAASICFWQAGDGYRKLTLDTRNGGKGVQLHNRLLPAATIVATSSADHENVFATAQRFCRMMCSTPLNPARPVYGINDWYVTYGRNSAEIILQHTARMAQLASNADNPPFSVIDAGWATYSPLLPEDCCWQDDYSRPNDHFKDMATVAAEIKKLGMRPALWTRPLCASHKDKQNVLLPLIKGRDAKKPVLDPTIPENLQRIRANMQLYKQWGYAMVKHDFTTYDMLGKWGNRMNDSFTEPGWGFNDTSKTNAEIILQLYRHIREASDGLYLLGCNTMSHLSAGLFEVNRIGDDTSGKEWERTRRMGVNTLGFRMPHHHHFYSADGDCVGLTDAVPWQKNRQWMQLLAESSTPLFISAQEKATGKTQQEFIKQSFAQASKPQPVAEPLDWLTNQFPQRWRLNGKEVRFNWNE